MRLTHVEWKKLVSIPGEFGHVEARAHADIDEGKEPASVFAALQVHVNAAIKTELEDIAKDRQKVFEAYAEDLDPGFREREPEAF